jgi:hypothetical protein
MNSRNTFERRTRRYSMILTYGLPCALVALNRATSGRTTVPSACASSQRASGAEKKNEHGQTCRLPRSVESLRSARGFSLSHRGNTLPFTREIIMGGFAEWHHRWCGDQPRTLADRWYDEYLDLCSSLRVTPIDRRSTERWLEHRRVLLAGSGRRSR